jgi:hypothetical protein
MIVRDEASESKVGLETDRLSSSSGDRKSAMAVYPFPRVCIRLEAQPCKRMYRGLASGISDGNENDRDRNRQGREGLRGLASLGSFTRRTIV